MQEHASECDTLLIILPVADSTDDVSVRISLMIPLMNHSCTLPASPVLHLYCLRFPLFFECSPRPSLLISHSFFIRCQSCSGTRSRFAYSEALMPASTRSNTRSGLSTLQRGPKGSSAWRSG